MNPTTPAADWLAALAPDHAPPPPGWWPLAPGWWLLAALLILAAVVSVLWLRRPERRLRRQALAELEQIRSQQADLPGTAAALENLLRRFALARFGRERCAALSGDAWLAFLVAEGAAPLAGDSGKAMLRAAWGSPAEDARAQWFDGAHAFLSRAGKGRKKGKPA